MAGLGPPYNAAMTTQPFNWKAIAGRTLQAALNRALALDPETRDALAALDGQCVALTVLPSTNMPSTHPAAPLSLQIRVDGRRLVVGPVDADALPDLSVRGTLSGLLSQLPPPLGKVFRRNGASSPGRVRLEGDAELARHLQRLAAGFDPDWQQPFASVFGDVLGVQIAKAFAGALKGALAAGRDFAETSAEFVTEESRDVVGRDELDAFNDDVDVLRDDVERMAARIARLQPLDVGHRA